MEQPVGRQHPNRVLTQLSPSCSASPELQPRPQLERPGLWCACAVSSGWSVVSTFQNNGTRERSCGRPGSFPLAAGLKPRCWRLRDPGAACRGESGKTVFWKVWFSVGNAARVPSRSGSLKRFWSLCFKKSRPAIDVWCACVLCLYIVFISLFFSFSVFLIWLLIWCSTRWICGF